MTVRLDLNGLLAADRGRGRESTPEELEALAPELERVRRALAERRAQGGLAFADLPYRRADLQGIARAARGRRDRFDTLVVLGIGGSALGAACARRRRSATRGRAARRGRRDSIDPDALRALLGELDLQRTLFNVVSKSGDTAETMARFLIVRDRLMREFGAVDYKDHILVTTEARARLAAPDRERRGIPRRCRCRRTSTGASPRSPRSASSRPPRRASTSRSCSRARPSMDERMRAAESPLGDPALALGGRALAARQRARRKHIVVLMTYAERLAAAGDWFCQLWGESLGKAVDRDGRLVEHGQTAVRARGSADQHSQLQLYLEGPRDKVVLFLRVEDHGEPLDIPAAYQDIEEVGCLGGNSLGALLNGVAARDRARAGAARPAERDARRCPP